MEKNEAPPDDAETAAETERIFQKAGPDIEVKVRMLNINHGHNSQLLSSCQPLREYAWFISRVRKYISDARTGTDHHKTPAGIGDAIDRAISDMPRDFEIYHFISSNRAEVKDMCLTEYNEAETMEMLRQEGRQEGLLEGRQEGRHESRLLDIKNLMDSTGWTAEKAMDLLKIPLNQRTALYSGLSKNI